MSVPHRTTPISANPTVKATRSQCGLIVARLQGGEAPVHQVRDLVLRRGEQELADPDVVDEKPVIVHDVDDVEGLAVLSVLAHIVQHLAHRPVVADGNVKYFCWFAGLESSKTINLRACPFFQKC
jgi:hypothetical protein